MPWHAHLSLDYHHRAGRTTAHFTHDGPLRVLRRPGHGPPCAEESPQVDWWAGTHCTCSGMPGLTLMVEPLMQLSQQVWALPRQLPWWLAAPRPNICAI